MAIFDPRSSAGDSRQRPLEALRGRRSRSRYQSGSERRRDLRIDRTRWSRQDHDLPDYSGRDGGYLGRGGSFRPAGARERARGALLDGGRLHQRRGEGATGRQSRVRGLKMGRIIAQTRKELTQIVRDWRTLALTLVLPMFLLILSLARAIGRAAEDLPLFLRLQ